MSKGSGTIFDQEAYESIASSLLTFLPAFKIPTADGGLFYQLDYLDYVSDLFDGCFPTDFLSVKNSISNDLENILNEIDKILKGLDESAGTMAIAVASGVSVLGEAAATALNKRNDSNNTGSNSNGNTVNNYIVTNPGNGNTNADMSDNGTQRNVETEEEKKRQEEERKRQEEENKRRQEEENRRREEENRRQEEENRRRQEEERQRQEEERQRQEEERQRQEEERQRQEEERQRQEEERRKHEEDGANTGSDVAIPPTPGSNNGNGSNNNTSVPIPNTETHSDNPIAAGVDKVAPEKPGDSTGTSIVGEAKDLFKNKNKGKSGSTPVLPKSGNTKSTTSSSSSSNGFNPVPLAVGLGAAVAGGVGIKAYKDHKENSSFNDENEDSFSNGNRFWSEDDPNVINSEEDMVSGDDLFSEQTTSPSYSAMINEDNNSISNEGWAFEEQPVEDNDSFNLLGEN